MRQGLNAWVLGTGVVSNIVLLWALGRSRSLHCAIEVLAFRTHLALQFFLALSVTSRGDICCDFIWGCVRSTKGDKASLGS